MLQFTKLKQQSPSQTTTKGKLSSLHLQTNLTNHQIRPENENSATNSSTKGNHSTSHYKKFKHKHQIKPWKEGEKKREKNNNSSSQLNSFKHKHHIKPRREKTKNSPVCNFEGSNTDTKIKKPRKRKLQLPISEGPISSFQFQKVLSPVSKGPKGPISSFQFPKVRKVLYPVSNFKRSKHTVSTHTQKKNLPRTNCIKLKDDG